MTIIVVNDGECCWTVPRATLIAAMERLGWTRSGAYGVRWDEPDGEEPGQAYEKLCRAVAPEVVLNTAAGDEIPDELFACSLTWRPDWDAWEETR